MLGRREVDEPERNLRRLVVADVAMADGDRPPAVGGDRGRTEAGLRILGQDALVAGSGVDRRDLPDARKETAALAKRFTTPDVLRKIRRLEELRDQLGRNIQEALAIEVTFLGIFAS